THAEEVEFAAIVIVSEAQTALRGLHRQLNEATSARGEAQREETRFAQMRDFLNKPPELDSSLNAMLEQSEAQLEKDQAAHAASLRARSLKEEDVESYTFWGKQFLQLRLRLMQCALEELQLLAVPFLEQLGLPGWRLEFAAEQTGDSGSRVGVQRLEIRIYRPGEEEEAVCSGGEYVRLRLAAQMALAASTVDSAKFGFEVWDEPSGYLSGAGLEDLLEVLSSRAQAERKVIYLVDHTVPEFGLFDGVLTLVRSEQEVTAQWNQ
ncbi:MAG: hypothetical protein ACRD22_14150, partial [Terriglobia bacterium]